MSKYVKQLITNEIRNRLDGVQYLMLVSLTGIDANVNKNIRANLAGKGINLMVIKNSLADRAAEGTPLAAAFNNLTGANAVCWGATDIVALAKELVNLSKNKEHKGFEIKGAVLDSEVFDAKQAVEVSKWLSREEQISVIVGQIVSIGAKLSGQFISVGSAVASQIVKIADKEVEVTNSETTSSETANSETASNETTSSETASSETTSSETTSSETASSENKTEEKTATETTT
ncbi:MAG: 50S ribosomal protein L10 [Planctomycetaceae bacterium]|jgi:large subunit ribosomal protein L10|nr:50S ribosomal protein L10 [Planctomycetaceae bacterium]